MLKFCSFVFCLAGAMWGASVDVTVSGTTSASFVDTYGFFASPGTFFASGTAFLMHTTYDLALCATQNLGGSAEFYSNCDPGAQSMQFTLNSVTLSNANLPPNPSWIEHEESGGNDQFNYWVVNNTWGFNHVFTTATPYAVGALANQPSNVVSAQLGICSGANCISFGSTDASLIAGGSGSVPEPGTLALCLPMLASLVYAVRRRAGRTRQA